MSITIEQETQHNKFVETSDITPLKACFKFIFPKQLIKTSSNEYKIKNEMMNELKSLITSAISTTKTLKIKPTVLNVEEPDNRLKSVSQTIREDIYLIHDLPSYRDDSVCIQWFEIDLSNFSFTEAATILNPDRLNENYRETSKTYYLLFESLTYFQDFAGCLDTSAIFNYLVNKLNFAIEGKPINELKHNFLNSTVKEPSTNDIVFYMRNIKFECIRKEYNETREILTLFNRKTFIFNKHKTEHFFNMVNYWILDPFAYLSNEEISNNKNISFETASPITAADIQNIPSDILKKGMIVKELENKMREILEIFKNSFTNSLASIEDKTKIDVIAIIHQYQNQYLIFTSDKEFYKANTFINNIIDDMLISGKISFKFKNIVYYNDKFILSFRPANIENTKTGGFYTHIKNIKYNEELEQVNNTQSQQFNTFSKYNLESINHTINLPTLRRINKLTENSYLVVALEKLITKKQELIYVLRLDGYNFDFKANFYINKIFESHGIPNHKFQIFKGTIILSPNNKNECQWFLTEEERNEALKEQERKKQKEILLKEEQAKIKKQLREQQNQQQKQEQEQKRKDQRKLMKHNLIRLDDVEENTTIIIEKVFRRPTGKRDKFIIESNNSYYLSNQFAEDEIKKYEADDLQRYILKVLKFKTTKTKKVIRNVELIKSDL